MRVAAVSTKTQPADTRPAHLPAAFGMVSSPLQCFLSLVARIGFYYVPYAGRDQNDRNFPQRLPAALFIVVPHGTTDSIPFASPVLVWPLFGIHPAPSPVYLPRSCLVSLSLQDGSSRGIMVPEFAAGS